MVMVTGILTNAYTFCFLFAIVTGLLLTEFYGLMNEHEDVDVNVTVSTAAGVLLFLGVFLCVALPGRIFGRHGAVMLSPYLLSLLYLSVSELYRSQGRRYRNWLIAFSGHLYIALPFALLCITGFYNGYSYSSVFPLAIFVFLWLSDTGAYCAGSFLSRYVPSKLFPSVSPKKSWIGSVGGGVVALAGSLVFANLHDVLNALEWMGLALICVVFGTYGDLVESGIKRQMGIKDSGSFLPGHGGALDRFDSSLVAIPASTIYLFLVL